jgi:predicted Holliday junction resolvase-like endonuclease
MTTANEATSNLTSTTARIGTSSDTATLARRARCREEEIRRDAILRSGVVTKGMVTQHIVPYLPGFDLDPKDIRFLGSPVDLIAFKGLNASVEDDVEIVFIEVKTGKSPLSQRERRIRKAVVGKRVSWRIFNPDEVALSPEGA